VRWALFAGAALTMLCSCSAVENPSRSELRPAGAANASRPQTPARDEDGEPEPLEAPSVALADEPAGKIIATVDGRPIGVSEFLTRAWLRDSKRSREILDHLVVERLAILEAERIGLSIPTELVDQRLERAHAALAAQLAESGSELTPAEHVERNLGLLPAFYDRQLRHETLVQLIAARCVRVWAMEQERRVVRCIEVESRADLDEVRAELASGGDFDALAERTGRDAPGRLNLARAESSPLARLAFATEIGGVGGPLEEGERFLLMKVESSLEPVTGPWGEIAERVERSLEEDPVDDIEFVQWRAAMARRYAVDLEPFFEAIGTTR
jgi:hypothetical protein